MALKKRDAATSAAYLRNFVFGVEDSLVSTVGLLSGVAIAGMDSRAIFITGIVLIFVEAFSMAIGSLLSEHSAEAFLQQAEVPLAGSIAVGGVMFFSYFISGFIPLFPYLIWNPITAFWYSMAFSLAALFLLGVTGARLSGLSTIRSGLSMLIIGGIAIGLGVAVGGIANGFGA